MPAKIILDTDIGDDVDDALALAFALQSQAIDLTGVTTVHGNTLFRAQLAENLLDVFGRADIPVLQGIGMPLDGGLDCNMAPYQYDAVQDRFRSHSYDDAISFMLSAIRSGRCDTVVAIGALTNVARCILLEPDTMLKCRLVLMGGMISSAYPEANIAADPEAASIVFGHPMDKVMIGLDVTLKCGLPNVRLQEIYRREEGCYRYLTGLIRLWQRGTLAGILHQWGGADTDVEESDTGAHDPMAAAYIACPSLFALRDAHILVEMEGRYTRGVTVDDRNVFRGTPNGVNCRVAVDVDVDAFLDLYFSTLLGRGRI